MFANDPDFYESYAMLPHVEVHLLTDASPEQIAIVTTLFDVLGDPSYNPDRSDISVQLGSTYRWFGEREYLVFLTRSSALFGSPSALSVMTKCGAGNTTVNSPDDSTASA
ncbi:MAG: hypothetical protein ABMA26_22675 [Limisphaerales bacterium]